MDSYHRGSTTDRQYSNDPQTVMTRTGRLLLDMKESRYSYSLDNIRKRIEDEATYFDLKLTKMEDSSVVPIADFTDNTDTKKAFACPAKPDDAHHLNGKLLIDEYNNEKICIFTVDLTGSALGQIIREFILKDVILPKFGKIYFILFKIKSRDVKFKGPDQVNAFRLRLTNLTLTCALSDIVFDNGKYMHKLLIQENWAGWLIKTGQIPPAELKLPDPEEKTKVEDQLKRFLNIHEEREKVLKAQADVKGEKIDPLEMAFEDLDEPKKELAQEVAKAIMKAFNPQKTEILERPEEDEDKKVREELIKQMDMKDGARPKEREEQKILRRSGNFVQVEPTGVLSPSKGQVVLRTLMHPETDKFEFVTERSKAHKGLNRKNPDGESFDGKLKKLLDGQRRMNNLLVQYDGMSTPKKDKKEVAKDIIELSAELLDRMKAGQAESDDIENFLENVNEELGEVQRSGNGKAFNRPSSSSEGTNSSGYTTPERGRNLSPLSQLSTLPSCAECGRPKFYCICRGDKRQKRLQQSMEAKKRLQFATTSPVVRTYGDPSPGTFEEQVSTEKDKHLEFVQNALARGEKIPIASPASPKDLIEEAELKKYREAHPGSELDRICEKQDNAARLKFGFPAKPTTKLYSKVEYENLIEEKKDFLNLKGIELEPEDYCKFTTKSGFMALRMIEEKQELVKDCEVAEVATLQALVAKLEAEFDTSLVCKVCQEIHDDKKMTNG